MNTTVSVSEIKNRIYSVRGNKVMLDNDLAEFYQTKTRILNQAVQRNSDRFPIDFRFHLTRKEHVDLFSEVEIPKKQSRGGRAYLPYGYTQEGIAMLSSVLKSERAVQVNILIMRAFVQTRQVSETQLDLGKRLDLLEKTVLEAIQRPSTGSLPNQTTTFLVSYFNSDLRESDAQSYLPRPAETNSPKNDQEVNINGIHRMVAQYFGLRIQDLKSASRTKRVALPRQIAIYLVRKHIGISFKDIGAFFGGKDHTTVLHACRKISILIGKDNKIREAIEKIEKSLIN